MGRLLGASSVAAEPAQLDYLAPPSCPDPAMFEQELSARLGGEPTSPATGRALRIRIEPSEPAGFVGRVEFLSQPGAYSQRELSAQTCEELTRALALVVAVVWNPEARQSSPADVGPRSEAGASPSELGKPASAVLERREAVDTQAPPNASQPSFEGRWFTRAWLGLALDSVSLPRASVLPRLGIAAERSVAPRLVLSAGISAALPSSQSATTSDVEGNFSFGAVRAEGCGAFALESRAHLEGCGVLELGRLAGESGVSPQSEQAVAWVAPGMLGRVRVRVAGPVWLQGGAGILWPLRRPVFYVDEPDKTQLVLHEVSSSGLTAELCAGIRLP